MSQNVIILLEILRYIFIFIGILASAYHAVKAWRSASVLTWRKVDRLVKKLIKSISQDNYYPDTIIAVGRGGAIIGSLLSGNLPKEFKESNIPIVCIDRFYKWEDGNRVELDINPVDYLFFKNKKVLLVAGDVISGETMRFFKSKVDPYANEVRTACLLKGITTIFNPDYFAKEIPAEFETPWMYKGYGYTKDSREPIGRKNNQWWVKFRNRIY